MQLPNQQPAFKIATPAKRNNILNGNWQSKHTTKQKSNLFGFNYQQVSKTHRSTLGLPQISRIIEPLNRNLAHKNPTFSTKKSRPTPTSTSKLNTPPPEVNSHSVFYWTRRKAKEFFRYIFKSYLILASITLLATMQMLTNGIHLIADSMHIFPVKEINISGDISLTAKKNILENPLLVNITNQGRSLLSIDTAQLARDLNASRNSIEKLTFNVHKNFPATLQLKVSEQNDIILLRVQNDTTAYLLGGGTLTPSKPIESNLVSNTAKFSYNHFTLDVDLNKPPQVEKQLAAQLMQVLQQSLGGLPTTEKDFLRIFSNLHFSDGVFTLYPISQSGKNTPKIFWLGELNTKKLREARYAYLYHQNHSDFSSWNAIDITSRLTRFTHLPQKTPETLARRITSTPLPIAIIPSSDLVQSN